MKAFKAPLPNEEINPETLEAALEQTAATCAAYEHLGIYLTGKGVLRHLRKIGAPAPLIAVTQMALNEAYKRLHPDFKEAVPTVREPELSVN